MNPYGIIYKITNLVNGKCYVGQTTKTAKLRFSEHISTALGKHRNSILYLAILKYGKENFKTEELDVAFSKKELDFKEDYHILDINTLSPSGYNLRRGGITRGLASDELKKKLSDSLRLAKSRPVYATNIKTGEKRFYSFMPEASKDGFNPSAISSVCSGRIKSHLGWFFSYNEFDLPKSNKVPVSLLKNIYAKHINTGEEMFFLSSVEARKFGFSNTSISSVLKGNHPHHKGWMFTFDPTKWIQEVDYTGNFKHSTKRKEIYGKNVKTGELLNFSFLRECEQYGFSSGHVCDATSGKLKQIKGYVFAYSSDELEEKLKNLQRKKPIARNTKIIGTNTENGESKSYENSYGPVSDGFNQASVWLCCNGKQKTHKGYIWRYV